MELIPINTPLKIPVERLVTINAGDIKFNISCTPVFLKELTVGFLVSEGLVEKGKEIDVKIDGDSIYVDAIDSIQGFRLRSSGSPGVFRVVEELPRVSGGEKFTIEECRNSLKYLETEEYKMTRGYHTAALCGKDGLLQRAYDVGRHNAVDKVLGMGILNCVDFEKIFLLVSGRISQGMVAKCVRCGIPLLVSKAAILDSAIAKCGETGLSVVSFATNIAVKGDSIEV